MGELRHRGCSECPQSALGVDRHERPIAAIRCSALRCGAASPKRTMARVYLPSLALVSACCWPFSGRIHITNLIVLSFSVCSQYGLTAELGYN
jgi:hypothetical protein